MCMTHGCRFGAKPYLVSKCDRERAPPPPPEEENTAKAKKEGFKTKRQTKLACVYVLADVLGVDDHRPIRSINTGADVRASM